MVAPEEQQRCLVVDADPLLRWSLVRFLEARGLEARSAESGELALAILQEWPVDLLIADTCLPGMDGLALVHRCQGLRDRPRIMLLSGSEGEPLPDDLSRLGVISVIEKPLIIEALTRVLADVLQPRGGAAG